MATAHDLAFALHDALQRRRWTLAVAESCTGGLLAGSLSQVPGCSGYFRGGVIAYANDVKERVLGVPPALLDGKGAVSAEVAVSMARGVVRALSADVGVGVTGVAGPGGGTAEKPVGLVFVAVTRGDVADVREFQFAGDRATVRQSAVREALAMIKHCVELWN